MDVEPTKPASIEAYRELSPTTPYSLAMWHVSRATELLNAVHARALSGDPASKHVMLAQEHRAMASLLFGLQR